MICLYWNIDRAILKKQEEEGWGAKVIDRMAKDLKDAFPENWPDFEIVQRAVAQLEFRYTERYW